MSAPRPWEKEHLWLALLALGFEPGAAAATAGKISTHLSLGVSMFDKPNKDAFHVVARFLFSKLDHSRCVEVFRFCCPPADKKGDAEFRKQCCQWLRKISDECGNNFPPVVASVFLSPGGSKFIHLMYHLSRYVLIQHIKMDSEGAGIPYPKAVNSRPSDLYKAAARYSMAYNRFLRTVKKEDILIQEYQKKAQLLVKQIRELRSECAELHKRLQKVEQNSDQNLSIKAESVQKVRAMWASIMETLKLLEKEKEVVDSVLKGHVDQYVLDGTDVTICVPRLLLDKIENVMYKLQIGNVYEAGKLNVLTVIQLLNESLKMLMSERQQVDQEALKLDVLCIEGKTKFQNEIFLGLKSMRHKLKREDHVSINESIAEKQTEWDMKWESCLGQSPFCLIKDQNPALDFLPTMSPLSFDPATEEAYKSSVFCQYPASIPETPKKISPTDDFLRDDGELESGADETAITTGRIFMRCPESATISEVRNMMPFEKEENTGTSKGRKKYISQNLKPKGDTPRPLEAWKNKDTSVLGTPSPVKREDPRKKAQEQLAEEVADVVMSDFAQSSAGKGMSLEDLIGSLVSDPFLSKNQIPRTPENLITEIRRSWRKAIEDEDSSDAELAHAEIMTKKAPQDTEPAFQIQTDSSMACFMSFSRLSDLDDATALQEQVVTSYSSESPMQQPAAGKSDDKTHLEPRLTCVASNKSVLKTPEESVCPVVDKSIHNVLDYGTEEHVGTIDTLVPFLSQNSSGHTTLSWNASQMVGDTSSDSRDAIQFGILHETLPEQVSNTSLNSSKNVETDDEGTEEDNFRGSKSLAENLVKDEWTPVERKQYLQSIRSKLEALKKTASGNEEDSSPRTQFIRRRSELSVTPRSKETSDVFSPLVKLYSLDAEHIKTPCESHLERKLTLSPLIAFSPVQARQRSAMHKPGDFLLKLKGESLGTKESSSEANTCKDEAVSQLIEL